MKKQIKNTALAGAALLAMAGAANAALFAVAMLALSDASLAKRLAAFRARQARAVIAAKLPD